MSQNQSSQGALEKTQKHGWLHAVCLPGGRWGLVTSNLEDAVTINAKIIAENMNQENAESLAGCWNMHVLRQEGK